jgi:GH24 family phage-related lysozyme (muramidase)
MSIFRNTLQTSVQEQLKARQNALKSRTPDAIIQANSRNAWIRMTSAVDVSDDKGKLANQYVLLGGVLADKKLRAGVGGQSGAYNNISPSGTSYNSNAKAGTAGIKPMPGIESIDIKSKSAYGSLREVVVNFKCHNLQQLEDLELLYMRPGYTVLVEWGWAPYLDKNGKIQNNIEFYDGVLDGNKTREEVWNEIYKLSVKKEHNYEGHYGYVKNYSWSARMDGGYDCSTTIISIGEVMESLKVGYLPYDVKKGIIDQNGLLGLAPPPPSPTTFLTAPAVKTYYQNKLAGLLQEIYQNASDNFNIPPYDNFPKLRVTGSVVGSPSIAPSLDYDLFAMHYDISPKPENTLSTSLTQIYITLESFVKLLNEKVLMYAGKNEGNSSPLISISTKPRTYEYDDKNPNPNPNEKSLLCLAHPLQVSVDPTVCLITNSLWAKGISFDGANKGAGNGAPTSYDGEALDIYNKLDNGDDAASIGKQLLSSMGYHKPGYSIDTAKEFVRSFAKVWREKNPNETKNVPEQIKSTLNILSNYLIDIDGTKLDSNNATYQTLFSINTINDNDKEEANKKNLSNAPGSNGVVEYLATLENGKHLFENGNETGNIGNIYLNVDFLYRTSIDSSVKDPKTQDLKLYEYLMRILKNVQESIGGVNNFEIHVDPIDNVIRIIDLNYVDILTKGDAYDKAFTIEAQNLSGTVRSYDLQSKIFPEQAAMIAIGAQVKGGNVQGTSAQTLLDFNNDLQDRIIPKKFDPPGHSSQLVDTATQQYEKLKDDINVLKDFFFKPVSTADPSKPSQDQLTASEYKTSLRDIIAYFQNIVKTTTNSRAIIPIQISLTMDGIGGLVIGHLFKIPPDLLPKGYGGNSTVGGKFLQTITSLSHKVGNGDWTTTIDAQNIVVNDASVGIISNFSDLLIKNPNGGVDVSTLAPSTLTGGYLGIAIKFISAREGFEEYGKWDYTKFRAGYGSDVIKKADGSIVPVTEGMKVTREDADRTLTDILQKDYIPGVILSVGRETWNTLNPNQQAALISYGYNAGPAAPEKYGVTAALKAGRQDLAAQIIGSKPNTATDKKTGKVSYPPGLATRRRDEAALFLTQYTQYTAPTPSSNSPKFIDPNKLTS